MITKIALIQQPAGDNINENLSAGIEAVKNAAAQGAEIICFSELAFTKFYPQYKAEENYLELAEEIPGPITGEFQKLAKELGVVIIPNLYEREGDKAYDSSPVIDHNGEILGVTRMLHITDYEYFHEKGYYTPGNNNITIYNTKFGSIGIAICYDRHYPEYMRTLALKGAEIVFVPQAGAVGEWPEGLYEAEMRIAAFQNGYYTALCNRVGKEENLRFSGESFICNPEGQVIARAGLGTSEILFAELDLDAIKDSNAKKLFIPDRRPGLYSEWFNGK